MQKRVIKIAIDGNEANVLNRVGSNTYAYEILCQLEKITQNDPLITWTILLNSPPVKDLPKIRKGWIYAEIKPKTFWTQWTLPIHLFLHRDQYQVFFTPGHYAPRYSSIPYVSSVMDLAFLHHSNFFKTRDLVQLKNWTDYSVTGAEKVITISQTVKNDISKQYKKSADDIIVAYPGKQDYSSPNKTTATKILKKLAIQPPYFLFVGTIQPRKNLQLLIEAFEQLTQKITLFEADSNKTLPPVQLVLAGKVGWLAEPILDRMTQSSFSDSIKQIGFVDDNTKQVLISQAEGLVLIGLEEGFGIPALEAMELGTIPIVSHSSSLPEVVGDAGILVDPTNVRDVTQALYHVLTMNKRQKALLRKKARAQSKQFSWQNSAQTILGVLKEVAQKTT